MNALHLMQEGYGFLRQSKFNYLPSTNDIYVSPNLIKKFNLRAGVAIQGKTIKTKENPALSEINSINDLSTEQYLKLVPFDQLVPSHPDERLRLETTNGPISMRVLDLISPIGKGQRGLIVSPPKSGKTYILKEIADSIKSNDPKSNVVVLLIDERPEEVTDMKMSLENRGVKIIASTFDRPAKEHIQIAEITIEMAKRKVEMGQDVVIILDSITRLSRAYNSEVPHSGRTITGGLDINALAKPKHFFGSARKIVSGGSLTIIASALMDTGSKMDDIIFEEFKGTGNMEVYLDRKMADRRIFPAVDINKSGTRKEEMLFHPDELKLVWKLRKVISDMNPSTVMEHLTNRMSKTLTNAEFLMSMRS